MNEKLTQSDFKRKTNKLVRKNFIAERNLLAFSELLKSGEEHKDKLISPNKNYKSSVSMYEIIISDLHYSGKIDDVQVRKFLKAQINELKENYTKGTKVRLSFLADDIEGELHLSSLDKHQEENTISQIIGVQKHYANFINSVSAIVPPKDIEVVFVPESNHGQLRFHGMTRGQQPRNDVGYVIRDYLMLSSHKDIKFWKSKHGIVETNDAFYMHGDKPFMKSADKVRLTLGKEKHIMMGHWHTMKISQHGHYFLIVAPKATANQESYAIEAGYDNTHACSLHMTKYKNKIKNWKLVEVK